MNTMLYNVARDIVLTLHYNSSLSQDDKIFSVESKLNRLANEIEQACAEEYKRCKNNTVISVDERPQDIPVLAQAMIAQQLQRGPAN